MEDVLKRLSNLETDASSLKSQVSALLTSIPHLGTKAQISDVRTAIAETRADLLQEIGEVRTDLTTQIGQVRTDLSAQIGQVRSDLTTQIGQVRTDLSAQIGQLKADLSAGLGHAQANLAAAETAIIKWIIATVLTSAGLAFAIAKFVH